MSVLELANLLGGRLTRATACTRCAKVRVEGQEKVCLHDNFSNEKKLEQGVKTGGREKIVIRESEWKVRLARLGGKSDLKAGQAGRKIRLKGRPGWEESQT